MRRYMAKSAEVKALMRGETLTVEHWLPSRVRVVHAVHKANGTADTNIVRRDGDNLVRCMWGGVGGRLYVAETIDWNRSPNNPRACAPTYRADGAPVKTGIGFFRTGKGPTCSSCFMPQDFARLFLTVLDIEVVPKLDAGGRLIGFKWLVTVKKEICYE